jgi:hypothetical protein
MSTKGVFAKWFAHHKLYRDIWLIIITALVVLALNAIQESRREALVRSCEDTNQRNEQTIKAIDTIISAIDDPVQRKQAEQGRANTIFLIAALAPYTRDCQARADRLLGR